MKSKLPLIVVVFVILPTAVLSLLAARNLRHDVVIARSRLELSAANAVSAAVNALQARLQDDLRQVCGGMREAVAAGGDLQRFQSGAARLEQARPLVRRVYVFMNPWDFVWPESGGAREPEEGRERREALLSALRGAVASERPGVSGLPVTIDDRRLLFAPLGAGSVFYAGYEVDRDALAALAAKAVHDAAGGGIILRAHGEGLDASSLTDTRDVIVSDSFGQPTRMGGDIWRERSVLAARRLAAPFDGITVLAVSDDPQEFARMATMRIHLQRWGVLLLAIGIVAGAWWLLGEARSEIRRARSRSEFVIGVSHDLRTPLASMKMLAESLLLGHVRDAGRRAKFLETIVSEADRLEQLIERVLFLIRFGQDAVRYRLEPADAGALVAGTVTLFRQRFAGGDETEPDRPDIALDVAEGLPDVRMDATALRQVLLNLLDNAVKYGRKPVPEGVSAEPEAVRLEVTAHGETRRRRPGWPRRAWVVIGVRDYGMGIARAEQKRIFQRFYRSARANERNVSGVGLGLALCKHVVEAHGGWIEVESRLNRGSTFKVYLPKA